MVTIGSSFVNCQLLYVEMTPLGTINATDAASVRTKAAASRAPKTALAAFGTKRHRHINARTNGISRKSFGRIAYAGGSKRTSKKGLDALKDMTDMLLENIADRVLLITKLSKRKTISEADMHQALRRLNINVYCYDVSRMISSLRKTEARRKKTAVARKLTKQDQEEEEEDM